MTQRAAPDLHLAGTYRREVRASLARIWENVFDWEHLDHLHRDSFSGCILLDQGDWGWRLRLSLAGDDPGRGQVIELRVDRAAARYVTKTIEGVGAGTEVRVALAPRSAHATAVAVEFHVPEPNPDRRAAIGRAYAALYARLWDEDEAMMQARERALAGCKRRKGGPLSIALGPEAQVRARLPLTFEVGGGRYRLVEVDSKLVAHAILCPHWLGPLDQAPVIDGEVSCPWHGYRFDVRSGACVSGQRLSLGAAPSFTVTDGCVRAHAPGSSADL